MGMKKLIFLQIGILIILSGIVFGIGVSPSSLVIPYEAGAIKTYEFFGENKNNVDANIKIFIAGELKDYVEISQELDVIPAKKKKKFTFKIKHPEILSPGTYSGQLVLEERMGQEEFLAGASGFGAKGAVVMQLQVKVPYDGKYMEVKFPPMRSVVPKERIFLTLNAYNYGNEEIKDISGHLRILTPDSTEIAVIETILIESINPMEMGEFRAIWVVPAEAQAGEYKINAEIEYGGEKPAMASYPLRIGTESIDIVDVTTSNIQANSVGKFQINIKNKWNKELSNVYADIIIMLDGKIIKEIKTSSVDVYGFASSSLIGYWEIGDRTYKEYKAKIILHFGDSAVEKVISFGPEKAVEFETPYSGSIYIVGIIVITVILLSAIVGLVFLLRQKPHKR